MSARQRPGYLASALSCPQQHLFIGSLSAVASDGQVNYPFAEAGTEAFVVAVRPISFVLDISTTRGAAMKMEE